MEAPAHERPLDAPAASRLWIAAACGVVFLVGILLYAETVAYAFLNWDDGVYVVYNDWIQGLSLDGLRSIFSEGILGGLLPVHLLSYAFDHAIWGLDPSGYHLHSVLLNAANGALALWVVLEITRRPLVALLAALFFAVHPTHVSSVAWISARKELLYTFFLLASTASYLVARREGGLRRGPYLASIALFALGGMSKTTISVYPAFFFLLDVALDARRPAAERRPLAFHLKTKLPYLAIGVAVVVANLATQAYAPDSHVPSLYAYALTKGHAAWRYVWLLIGLMPGQPLYDAPVLRVGFGIALATFAPMLVVLGALALAWWRRRYDVGLALAWLVVGLIPPMLFPLVTFMADRYLYAPSLGFCWLLALGIDALGSRMRGPLWKGLLVGSSMLLVWGFLFPVQRAYLPTWRNSEALWTHAMEHSRDLRARSGLASALIEEGRPAEALDLMTDVELDLRGLVNRGIANVNLGRLHDALADVEHAQLLVTPQSNRHLVGELHALHAVALSKLGRSDEARDAVEEALRADPGNRRARALRVALAES